MPQVPDKSVECELWQQEAEVCVKTIIYAVGTIGNTIYVCHQLGIEAYNDKLEPLPKKTLNSEELRGIQGDEYYPAFIVDFAPINNTDVILATTMGLFHHVLGK